MKKLLLMIFVMCLTGIVKAQDTLYFDAKGNKVDSIHLAMYKTIVQPDKDDSSLQVCRIFWMFGQIKSETRYKVINGMLVHFGKQMEWGENGILSKISNYKDGVLDGDEVIYKDNGEVLTRKSFKNGVKIRSITTDSTDYEEEEPYVAVEFMPEFVGGENALKRFIFENLRYPVHAVNNGIQGRVIVQFVVEKNGDIVNPKILKGLGYGCDEEAIRIINSMPPWNPGRIKDRSVPVRFVLPIAFAIVHY